MYQTLTSGVSVCRSLSFLPLLVNQSAQNKTPCGTRGLASVVTDCQAEGKGFEPSTGFPASDFESATNRGKTRPVSIPASKSPAVAAEIPQDLQALIDAWPALPDAIKAGILAMVAAASRAAR
jgi:hypothetical protein